MRPAATVDAGSVEQGRELERDIKALSSKARGAGFTEVSHILAVAAEALHDALGDDVDADVSSGESAVG